jgi:hypothetical protein
MSSAYREIHRQKIAGLITPIVMVMKRESMSLAAAGSARRRGKVVRYKISPSALLLIIQISSVKPNGDFTSRPHNQNTVRPAKSKSNNEIRRDAIILLCNVEDNIRLGWKGDELQT